MRDDSDIRIDVINELKWQPLLKGNNIGVSVKNGVVTLSGEVDNYAQKLEAERAAKRITGVRTVAEDIHVGPATAFRKTDMEIAECVTKALKFSTVVPDERITVRVENGFVLLQGEVEWDFQRAAASRMIGELSGVRNVTNLITVRPRITTSDIRTRIGESFQRSATINAQNVKVEVFGDHVVLRGKVRSFAEKEDAEKAAWCAAGVSRVDNYLEVVSEEIFVF